jgi:hypothetical protein
LFFLFVAAKAKNRRANKRVVHAHDQRQRSPGLGDLFHGDDIGEEIHSGTAEIRRHEHSHESHATEPTHQLNWILGVAVHAIRDRFYFPFGKGGRGFSDQTLFFSEFEVHHPSGSQKLKFCFLSSPLLLLNSSPCPPHPRFPSCSFDHHRHRLAATDTEAHYARCQTVIFQRVDEGN